MQVGTLHNQKASLEAFSDFNQLQKSAPIFALVAGEASGDTLGANLIHALKVRFPNAKFVGIGGEKMQAQGLQSWYPMEWLSVMGFAEVLKSLRKLLKLRKTLTGRFISLNPDVFIGIDAPDFNFTLEKNLKAAGITTVHYVGPSVWAWREKRLQKIKRAVSGVLVLFPFEPPIYQRYQIPVKFVGHPLAANRVEKLDRLAAQQRLGLPAGNHYTVILVGSRKSEIQQMTPIYLQVVDRLQAVYPSMVFLFAAVNEQAKQQIQQLQVSLNIQANIKIVVGQTQSCLEASSQALVTSGTASLECALYELPMVIAIKVHWLSYWIMKRMATTQWIGLPNVLEQKSLVAECIQEDASVEMIFEKMCQVIDDDAFRQTQIAAFRAQYQTLAVDSATLSAEAVIQWAGLQPLENR